MIASLHYLFVFFPRSVNENDNHIYFNNLGLDYWGVIVGFFTLIVTLLVGWQIFSTIRERERNERLTDEMRQFQNNINTTQQNLEERLNGFEQCCEDRRLEIEKLNDKINLSVNSLLLIVSSDSMMRPLNINGKLSLTDAFRISKSFSMLLTAIYQLASTKSDIKNIKGNIVKLENCILFLKDRGQFNKDDFEHSSELFNALIPLVNEKEAQTDLQKIHSDMLSIGWNEEAERMHEFFRKLDEEKARENCNPQTPTEQ